MRCGGARRDIISRRGERGILSRGQHQRSRSQVGPRHQEVRGHDSEAKNDDVNRRIGNSGVPNRARRAIRTAEETIQRDGDGEGEHRPRRPRRVREPLTPQAQVWVGVNTRCEGSAYASGARGSTIDRECIV